MKSSGEIIGYESVYEKRLEIIFKFRISPPEGLIERPVNIFDFPQSFYIEV